MHNIGGNGLIQTRHAGVLGLCAFVKAHPYDVPDYLPEVFGHLGPHLTDPQPIPVSKVCFVIWVLRKLGLICIKEWHIDFLFLNKDLTKLFL